MRPAIRRAQAVFLLGLGMVLASYGWSDPLGDSVLIGGVAAMCSAVTTHITIALELRRARWAVRCVTGLCLAGLLMARLRPLGSVGWTYGLSAALCVATLWNWYEYGRMVRGAPARGICVLR